MRELEINFDEILVKINAKLKEAALALREANRLAYDEANLPGLIFTQFTDLSHIGCDYITDDDKRDDAINKLHDRLNKIDVSELEGELEDAGWSTSSSYC